MKKSSFLLIVAFFVVGIISPVRGEIPYWKIDEVQSGWDAEGSSVFRGIEPELFNVKMEGKTEYEGRIFFLAKISGGPDNIIDKAGVIAGMSGSPITYDGKLIGALSYAYLFQKEAVAGITPFEHMEEEARYGNNSLIGKYPKSITARYKGENIVLAAIPLANFDSELLRDTSYVSNLSFGAGAISNGIQKNTREKIKAGSAFSVAVIDGENVIDATGTVTAVDGDLVYAFGHPLLDAGNVEYSAWRSRIELVIPSFRNSFKISSPLWRGEEAAVFYDGKFGVYALRGKKANTIPFEFTYKKDGVETTHRFEIGRASEYTTFFAELASYLFFSNLDVKEESAFIVDSRVTIKRYPEIRIYETYFGIDSAFTIAMAFSFPWEERKGEAKFFSALDQIVSEFGLEAIQHLESTITCQESPNFFLIEHATLDRNGGEGERIYPNDTVYATLFISKLGAIDSPERIWKKITIPAKVPENAMHGDAFVSVGGSDQSEKEMAMERQFSHSTKEELVERINKSTVPPETISLVMKAATKEKNEINEIVDSVSSWKDAIAPIIAENTVISTNRIAFSEIPDAVVLGLQTLKFTVSKRPSAFRLEPETKIVEECIRAGEKISLMMVVAELDSFGTVKEKYAISDPIALTIPDDAAPGVARILIQDTISFEEAFSGPLFQLGIEEAKEIKEYSGYLYVQVVANKQESSSMNGEKEMNLLPMWENITGSQGAILEKTSSLNKILVTGNAAFVFVPDGTMEFSILVGESVGESISDENGEKK